MASSSVPALMKGVQMQHTGGPEVLQYRTDLPVPFPGDGELLVKNEYIGINYVDVYWRIGMMGTAPEGIIGREAEGKIVSTGAGDIGGFKVGDRVVWLSIGSYAEYTAVPSSLAFPIPPGIEPGMAAAALLQGLFALTLVEKIVHVKQGDWALVHAAAGGVGLWLCQLLRAHGAKTIATASTTEKLALAKANGADYTINYREEHDLVARVDEITQGHGVDIVYDGIGKDQTENNVQVVAQHGTIVTYGATSGFPGQVPHGQLVAKKARFVGPGQSSLMGNIGGEFQQWCAKLFDTMAKHNITIRIHRKYSLSEMRKAHEDLEARRTTGKVLVTP
ncbi:NAD(P)-binding protein [Karstenula rhodostoma CBS 690.94]|uniref:NAD(P)-binding protein n=1 Tax=Karstenula rhodostoma CBS 690.94 TaxID=1392251 RepID=A0A9P4P8B7_9PLEO|nr:NAD(P)-binding protein [Karstenula rhodostoma CBS 690.94]